MNPISHDLEVHQTWLGELVLRRRDAQGDLHPDVYEVTLDDQFLMSSYFNHSEMALANLGLAGARGEVLDVVVGGLGLGCTAAAALADPRLRSLLVVDCLEEVINWHVGGVVPLGAQLMADHRCRLVQGDFFAMAGPDGAGFDPAQANRRFHAILMDIDHSPRSLLHGTHQDFYEPEGLRQVASHLHPGGIFALWSADCAEPEFIDSLELVFDAFAVHEVVFFNPLLGHDELHTVYVSRTAGGPAPVAN